MGVKELYSKSKNKVVGGEEPSPKAKEHAKDKKSMAKPVVEKEIQGEQGEDIQDVQPVKKKTTKTFKVTMSMKRKGPEENKVDDEPVKGDDREAKMPGPSHDNVAPVQHAVARKSSHVTEILEKYKE